MSGGNRGGLARRRLVDGGGGGRYRIRMWLSPAVYAGALAGIDDLHDGAREISHPAGLHHCPVARQADLLD